MGVVRLREWRRQREEQDEELHAVVDELGFFAAHLLESAARLQRLRDGAADRRVLRLRQVAEQLRAAGAELAD
jgi:hypothetical protein